MGKPGDDFSSLLKEAIQKAYYDGLFNKVCDYADKIVMEAVLNREYEALTGNTVTSYAIGVYVYGDLRYTTFSHQNLMSPLRYKVQKGEIVWFDTPYEGEPRGGVGSIETSYEFGFETSFKLIKEHKASKSVPISLFMTTGTEYSAYLEFTKGLDVLTDTFVQFRDEFLSNIKPIYQ